MVALDFFFKNAWRWKCGLPDVEPKAKITKTLEEIKESQSNKEFEKLCENRMVLGYFRYGEIKGNKSKYDNIGSAIIRLNKYIETGNSEFLVDAVNLCMIEFTQENHPNFHFHSIDDGIHTKQI